MRDYAAANGKFPDGASSTEAFQKLLDEHFISDPGVFYVPFPGKTQAVSGARIRPENVSWDITCCLTSADSDLLPLVFLTGTKVTYAPGGTAVSRVPALPEFPRQQLTWYQWWNHDVLLASNGGLVVVYKAFGCESFPAGKGGVIANFISPNFNSYGRTYRQLTPDGSPP